MIRLPLTTLGVIFMVAVVSCDSDAVVDTTEIVTDAIPPVEVATTVLDAVLSGNTEVAADWTLLDQMPWMAMAEGASIQQAVGLLEEGSRQIAINYWQGFS